MCWLLLDVNIDDSEVFLMNDNDFKNITDIQRILKYLDNGKLEIEAWPNALELKTSLDKMINEHNEYMEHMKQHH